MDTGYVLVKNGLLPLVTSTYVTRAVSYDDGRPSSNDVTFFGGLQP